MKLQLDLTTWFLFFLVSSLWVISARLAGDRSERALLRWRVIPLSIFGLTWLAFGLQYIFRFLCLLYDPEFFRVTLYPPYMLSPGVLSQTWLVAGVFWLTLCLGYVSVLYWLRDSTPTWLLPICHFDRLTSLEGISLLDKMFAISAISAVLGNLPWVPISFVTPLGLISSLYIIPLTASWQLYFQGQPIGVRRFVYLFPGLALYYLSPYRLHLIVMIVCIILPAILFKPRLAFGKLFIGMILFLVISTAITDTYRTKVWGVSDKYARGSFSQQWQEWQANQGQSPWVRLLKRFHGFDSTAVTINAVPSFFPYTNRNVFTESLLATFVPRAIWDTKPLDASGRQFSVTIWALSERGLSKRESAPIAPSITGDLYHVHGFPIIILGGIIFGLVLGFLEKVKYVIGTSSQCIILAIFGVTAAQVLETDYVHSIGTILQRFIIVYVAVFLLSHVQLGPRNTDEDSSFKGWYRKNGINKSEYTTNEPH